MRVAAWTMVTALTACTFHLPGADPGQPADAPQPDAPPPPRDTPPVDTGCADDDHDTVCNVADRCPGGDDLLDSDADLIPNACDTWPCGIEPNAPSDTVVVGPGFTNMANIAFAGEGDQTSAVAAGTSVQFDFDFGLFYACGLQLSCREQMEFGFAGVGRIGCVVDSTQNDNTFLVSTNRTASVTVPSTPGVYELRIKAAGNPFGCGTSTSFTGGEPGGNATVAIVCVP